MRCHHCKTRLTPSTYVLMGNELYCRTHHRQLFLRKVMPGLTQRRLLPCQAQFVPSPSPSYPRQGKYVEGDKVGQYGLKAINGG